MRPGSEAGAVRGSIGLHTPWVQVLLALFLASVIVLWIGPRLRARAEGQSLPFLERPRGYLPIEEVLYQMRPAELGLTTWRSGQFAEYDLRSLEEDGTEGGVQLERRLRVDVLRAAAPEDRQATVFGLPHEDMHWLRLEGLRNFRGLGLSIFRLVSPHDLEISEAQPCFVYQQDYIPMRNGSILALGEELRLRAGGEELIDVGAGALRCERFEVSVAAPGRADEPLGELWFNRTVAPFGVVQARLASATLRLVDFGQGTMQEVPEPMGHLVEGRSTFAQFCDSCHGDTCHEKIDPPR